MHRLVSAVAGRLSLRPPQRHSLEILDRITEPASLRKGADPDTAFAALKAEWPGITDFERDFPSVCFALATGVGKTRLMGAFIKSTAYTAGAADSVHDYRIEPSPTACTDTRNSDPTPSGDSP